MNLEPAGSTFKESTEGLNVASSWCSDDDGCHWASHMRGGAPLYVKICTLCKRIDWDDLAEQVAQVRAEAWAAARSVVESAEFDSSHPNGGRALDAFQRSLVMALRIAEGIAARRRPPAESVVGAQAVGCCGDAMPSLVDVRPRHFCALPAGHAGWHRSDEGAEWTHGGPVGALPDQAGTPKHVEVPLSSQCRRGDCDSCDFGSIHAPCEHDCHVPESALPDRQKGDTE